MILHVLFVDAFDGIHPGHERILTTIIQPLAAERTHTVECSFLVCSDVLSGTQYRFGCRERVSLANILAKSMQSIKCDVYECDMRMPEVTRYSWTHPGETVSIVSMSNSEVLQFLCYQRPDAETTRINPPIVEPVFIEQRSLAMSVNRPNVLPSKTLDFSYMQPPCVPLLPVSPTAPTSPAEPAASTVSNMPAVQGASTADRHREPRSTRRPRRTEAAVSSVHPTAAVLRETESALDSAHSNHPVRAQAVSDTASYTSAHDEGIEGAHAAPQQQESHAIRVINLRDESVILTMTQELNGLLSALQHDAGPSDGEAVAVDIEEESLGDAAAAVPGTNGDVTDDDVSV